MLPGRSGPRMAHGPLLLGLLLLPLCSQVLRATASPEEHNHGQYVSGSYKMDPNGTYTDQPNNKTQCKCDLKCGINEKCVCSSSSQWCECKDGYIKGGNCPEFCELRARCENHTSPGPGMMVNDSPNHGTMEPPESRTSQHSETTPTSSTPTSSPPPTRATGSTGSGPLGWLIFVSVVFAVGTPLL